MYNSTSLEKYKKERERERWRVEGVVNGLTGNLMRAKARGELKKEKTTMGTVSVTYTFSSSSSPPLG